MLNFNGTAPDLAIGMLRRSSSTHTRTPLYYTLRRNPSVYCMIAGPNGLGNIEERREARTPSCAHWESESSAFLNPQAHVVLLPWLIVHLVRGRCGPLRTGRGDSVAAHGSVGHRPSHERPGRRVTFVGRPVEFRARRTSCSTSYRSTPAV